MRETLNKFIACLLLAALILPNSGCAPVLAGAVAVDELSWEPDREKEAEAYEKYQNAPPGWPKEQARKEYEAIKRANQDYTDSELILDLAIFTAAAAFVLVQAANKKEAGDDAAKKQPADSKAAGDAAKKQPADSPAGRAKSREDAPSGFSRGYIPPK